MPLSRPHDPDARPRRLGRCREPRLRSAQRLRHGDLEVAGKLAAEALALEPVNAAAVNLLGSIDFAAGRLDVAERRFRQALTTDPSLDRARFNLGLVSLERGDNAGAIGSISESLARGGSGDDHLILGNLLHGAGRIDEALEQWQLATAVDPGLGAPWLNIGSIERSRGRLDAARAALERAQALWPDSAAVLERARPGSVRAAPLCGSRRTLRAAVHSDMKHVDARVNLAETLRTLGAASEARQTLEQVVRDHPGAGVAHKALGLLALADARSQDAAAHLRIANELMPDDPQIAHLLAAAEGRPIEAAAPGYVRALFDGLAPRFDEELDATPRLSNAGRTCRGAARRPSRRRIIAQARRSRLRHRPRGEWRSLHCARTWKAWTFHRACSTRRGRAESMLGSSAVTSSSSFAMAIPVVSTSLSRQTSSSTSVVSMRRSRQSRTPWRPAGRFAFSLEVAQEEGDGQALLRASRAIRTPACRGTRIGRAVRIFGAPVARHDAALRPRRAGPRPDRRPRRGLNLVRLVAPAFQFRRSRSRTAPPRQRGAGSRPGRRRSYPARRAAATPSCRSGCPLSSRGGGLPSARVRPGHAPSGRREPDDGTRIDPLLVLGEVHYECRRYGDAIRVLRDALALDPGRSSRTPATAPMFCRSRRGRYGGRVLPVCCAGSTGALTRRPTWLPFCTPRVAWSKPKPRSKDTAATHPTIPGSTSCSASRARRGAASMQRSRVFAKRYAAGPLKPGPQRSSLSLWNRPGRSPRPCRTIGARRNCSLWCHRPGPTGYGPVSMQASNRERHPRLPAPSTPTVLVHRRAPCEYARPEPPTAHRVRIERLLRPRHPLLSRARAGAARPP